MGLETATHIQDLVVTNPVTGDLVMQGDDHFRMLKTVLKTTFPQATKPLYNSTATTKTASFTVASNEESKTFFVSTASAAVQATLPSLSVADAGWTCYFMKADSSTNGFWVKAASGNVISSGGSSVGLARRTIQGVRFAAFWSGSNWYVERIAREPVGAIIPASGLAHPSTPPCGYELCFGQTLTSPGTNYAEYVSLVHGSGILPDLRGRAIYGLDGGTGRLGAVMTGSLWNSGGAETVGLVEAHIGSHQHGIGFNTQGRSAAHTHDTGIGGSTGTVSAFHGHGYTAPGTNIATNFGAQYFACNQSSGATTGSDDTNHSHAQTGSWGSGTESADHVHFVSGSTDFRGSGVAHSNLPPAFVLNYWMVVE